MRLNSTPENIGAAMENVHFILRICSLSRVKNAKNGYTLVKKSKRSIVLAIILIITDFYFLISERFYHYTNMPILFLVEFFSSTSFISNFIVTLYIVNYHEINARRELDNLIKIDEYCGVQCAETYKKDRCTMNRLFYVLLTLHMSGMFYNCYGFVYVNGVFKGLPYAPQVWMQFLQGANVAYNISKLKVYIHRMSEMRAQIELSMKNVRVGRDERGMGSKMKSCYVKMYEIVLMFNESRGLQVLLVYARMLIDTIGIIGYLAIEKSRHLVGIPYGAVSLLVINIIMLMMMLFYSTILLQKSHQIASFVDRSLADKFIASERERISWREFVELAHRCPLVLTAYDFFTLDYSLIGATFGTIVTYTIILTQLNP